MCALKYKQMKPARNFGLFFFYEQNAQCLSLSLNSSTQIFLNNSESVCLMCDRR